MNEAIELAVEKGGYRRIAIPFEFHDTYLKYHRGSLLTYTAVADLICDPLFWQSLGKALGWIEDATAPDEIENGLPDWAKGGTLELIGPDLKTPMWKYAAHQYFDLVLTGGDTEKFCKDLIKN